MKEEEIDHYECKWCHKISKTEIYEDCPFFAEANAVGVHYHHSWQSFKKGETWIDKIYQPYGPSGKYNRP